MAVSMERERDFDAETLVGDWDDDCLQHLGVTIGAWTFASARVLQTLQMSLRGGI
jgi:hypothetical protein